MMEPSTIDYMAVKGGHPIVEDFRSGQILPRPTLLMKVSCNRKGSELVRALEPLDQIYTRLKGGSEFPAIVASEFGKGRSVYFACSIGSDYHTYKLSQYGKLVENAVRWSSGGKIPMQIEAPGSVEMELRGQPEHSRLLIHLVNHTGEMKRPIGRIIPVRDIKEKVMREKARRVYSLTTQEDLDFEVKNEWIEFVIPQIEIYEVIVLKTERALKSSHIQEGTTVRALVIDEVRVYKCGLGMDFTYSTGHRTYGSSIIWEIRSGEYVGFGEGACWSTEHWDATQRVAQMLIKRMFLRCEAIIPSILDKRAFVPARPFPQP